MSLILNNRMQNKLNDMFNHFNTANKHKCDRRTTYVQAIELSWLMPHRPATRCTASLTGKIR